MCSIQTFEWLLSVPHALERELERSLLQPWLSQDHDDGSDSDSADEQSTTPKGLLDHGLREAAHRRRTRYMQASSSPQAHAQSTITVHISVRASKKQVKKTLPPDKTVQDLLHAVLSELDLSASDAYLYEIRMADDDEPYLPDMDLPPLQSPAKVSKLNITDVVLCQKGGEEYSKEEMNEGGDRPSSDEYLNVGRLGDCVEIRQAALDSSSEDEKLSRKPKALLLDSSALFHGPQPRKINNYLTGFDDDDYPQPENKPLREETAPPPSSPVKITIHKSLSARLIHSSKQIPPPLCLHKAASAFIHAPPTRTFTIITPEMAEQYRSGKSSYRRLLLASREKIKVVNEGEVEERKPILTEPDSNIFIINIDPGRRVFDLCAKMVRLLAVKTEAPIEPWHLGFETLANKHKLKMSTLIGDLPSKENILVLTDQLSHLASQTSAQPIEEDNRPNLSLFMYSQYTASTTSEWIVKWRANPVSQPCPAILEVTGNCLRHIYPGRHLGDISKSQISASMHDLYTGRARTKSDIDALSVNKFSTHKTSKFGAAQFSAAQFSAGQFCPGQFGADYFDAEQFDTTPFGGLPTCAPNKEPPQETRVDSLVAISLNPDIQRGFSITYILRRKTLRVSYEAQTGRQCAEIVSKLNFLKDLKLSKGLQAPQGNS